MIFRDRCRFGTETVRRGCGFGRLAGRVWVRRLRGENRQDFSNSCGAGADKNFNPRRILMYTLCFLSIAKIQKFNFDMKYFTGSLGKWLSSRRYANNFRAAIKHTLTLLCVLSGLLFVVTSLKEVPQAFSTAYTSLVTLTILCGCLYVGLRIGATRKHL